jgi:hypothetical protein
MKECMHGLRELVLLMGIFFGCALGFFIGQEQGYEQAKIEFSRPVVMSEKDLDNKCVAWFFDTNMKDAKKRMCGGK